MATMRIGKRKIFAERLGDLLRGDTLKNWSDALAIDYKRLRRWVAEGIERPTSATKNDLERICQRFGIDARLLWRPCDWGALCREMLEGEQSKFVPQADKDRLGALLEKMWNGCELLLLDQKEVDALEAAPTPEEVQSLLRYLWWESFDWHNLERPGFAKKILAWFRTDGSPSDLLDKLTDSYGLEKHPKPTPDETPPDFPPDELERVRAFIETKLTG